MDNTSPYEIIAAALTVYFAPTGTAFPAVDEEPSASWTKVGTSGPLNYSDEGVTVEHSQSIELWRALGDSGARKAFRTEEDQKFRLTLVDLTLEQYKLALNNNTITTTAASSGVPGTKKIGLSRGQTLHTVALLVRGPSPYMEDGVAQWEVPITVQTGSPEVVFVRDEPAGLELEWTTLVDPNAASADEYFGRFVAQTAEAES